MNLTRVVLAAIVVTAAAVSAQAPPPQASVPVFRTGTEAVEVDVQVVDKIGRPITDLAPGEFTLLVDGKPRPISTVDLVSYRTEAPAVATPADPAELAVLAASYSSNAGTLPGRLFVLVVDQGNMTKGGGRGAMEAIGRFVERLTPADRVALVTLPAGPAVDFTSDHALVRSAALKIVGGGANSYAGSYYRTLSLAEAFAFVTGSQRRLFTQAVAEECAFARSAEEAARCRIDMENEARSKVMTAHAAEQATVHVLQALFERLAAVDGQKFLVFVGQSLVTGSSFGYLDGISDLTWIASKAQAARISTYVLQIGNSFLQAFDVAERRPSRTLAEDSRLFDDGLTQLAGAAGGGFFRLTVKLDPAFDRIAQETSASYVLRFDVEQADRDGKPHAIAVRVNRPGVDVRARKSFVARGTEATTGRRLGLALKAPFVPHALTIDLATPVMRDPRAGAGRLLLSADIGCGPQAPASADVAVALTTPDGQTRTLTPESTTAIVRRGAEQCLYYATSVGIPETDSTLRLAAVSGDGRAGAVDRLVSRVAAEGGGLRLGSLLLTDPATRVDGKMKFVVDGTVAGDSVAAYIEAEALTRSAPPAGLHMLFEIAATAAGPALVSERPALVEDADPSRWYAETTLDLKALAPGQYVLRVVARGSSGELARTGRLLRVVR